MQFQQEIAPVASERGRLQIPNLLQTELIEYLSSERHLDVQPLRVQPLLQFVETGTEKTIPLRIQIVQDVRSRHKRLDPLLHSDGDQCEGLVPGLGTVVHIGQKMAMDVNHRLSAFRHPLSAFSALKRWGVLTADR